MCGRATFTIVASRTIISWVVRIAAMTATPITVLTPGGDVIKESIGAFPRVILAEGEYRAIARNEGKVFEREFNVVAGVDGDIEVLAR